jgi:hypothetical protein
MIGHSRMADALFKSKLALGIACAGAVSVGVLAALLWLRPGKLSMRWRGFCRQHATQALRFVVKSSQIPTRELMMLTGKL